MELPFFLFWGWLKWFLCKGVCVDDGYILLFHDLSVQEKKLPPPHDGPDLPSLQFLCGWKQLAKNIGRHEYAVF